MKKMKAFSAFTINCKRFNSFVNGIFQNFETKEK